MADPSITFNYTIVANRLGRAFDQTPWGINIALLSPGVPEQVIPNGVTAVLSGTFRFLELRNWAYLPRSHYRQPVQNVHLQPGDIVIITRDTNDRVHMLITYGMRQNVEPERIDFRATPEPPAAIVDRIRSSNGRMMRGDLTGSEADADLIESLLSASKAPAVNWAAINRARTFMDELHELALLHQSSKGRTYKGSMAHLLTDQGGQSGGKTLDDLISLLQNASKGPEAEINGGNAPLPRNVSILPPYDEAGVQENYGYLIEMDSLSALWSGILYQKLREDRGHPAPYSITNPDEAPQAINDMADAAYQAMIGPLAGLYNVKLGTANTFSRSLTSATLHFEFLTELFKDFQLPEASMKQLDDLLTTFVKNLSTIDFKHKEEASTLATTIRVNTCTAVNVTGNDTKPIYIYQPTTKLIYLRIDSEDFNWSLHGKAKAESYDFNMTYVVIEGELNLKQFLLQQEKLDTIMQFVISKNLKEYGLDVDAQQDILKTK